MAALAAVAGFVDVIGEPRIRALNDVWWHAGGNVVVVLIQVNNWYARYAEDTAAVVPKGLVLSFVVTGILLFTGWKGWEMSIDVASASPRTPSYGYRRLRRRLRAEPPSRDRRIEMI